MDRAIPIARAKRRKPMPPSLVFALANLVWCFGWLVHRVVDISLGDHSVWSMVLLAFWVAVTLVWWPIVRRKWAAWKDGD